MSDTAATHRTLRVLVDPGIAPLISHLNLANAYRVYLAMQWLNVHRFEGRGWLTYKELEAGLNEFGIEYKRLDYILEKGHEIFWKLRENRIRLIAHALKLPAKLASRVHPDVLDACRPARLRVLTDLSGTSADFTAQLYMAWIDNRNKSGKVQASRDFLGVLWNRTANTLRDWEERANVQAEPTYAQYGGTDPKMVPDHAVLYAAKDDNGQDVVRAMWQSTNVYSAITPTVEHNHVGQQRKARQLHKQLLKQHQPPAQWGGGLADTGRMYFEGKSVLDTSKALRRHLRKYGDSERRHYIVLGTKRTKKGRIVIMECYDPHTDLIHTDLKERDYKAEYRGEFLNKSLAFKEFGWCPTLREKPAVKKIESTIWGSVKGQDQLDPLLVLAVEMGARIILDTSGPAPYRSRYMAFQEAVEALRQFCRVSKKLRKKADFKALWREIYALPDVESLDARKAELRASTALLEIKLAQRRRFQKRLI